MNRLILLLLIGGFASAASAQSASVDATLEPGAVAVGADATDAKANDRNCMRDTGSLITVSENQRARRDGKQEKCVSAIGRSYSREDIDRTGSIDLRDALRRLDTSIR